VAYYEKYDQRDLQAMEDRDLPEPPGPLLISLDGEEWIVKASPESEALWGVIYERCGDQKPQNCTP
jgi:hypothetical protein